MIGNNEIIELHNSGLNAIEIADIIGVKADAVRKHLRLLGYGRKPVNKEDVLKLHNDGLSDAEIAIQLGCTRPNITHILNKMNIANRRSKINNIELRNRISKSLIGRYVGELNPNYKGYSNEKVIARGIFKTISKRLIRNNNYRCEACGKRGGDLHVHHIKPFSIIFTEFIETTYDGDINTIYDQLMSYHDFVDESNLVVLCKQCHFNVHYSDNHELNPFRWGSATTIERDK